MHYYKLNIPDWNLATSHLSLEEEAIYFRLVNYYYDTEAPISEETQWVFRRLRLGSHSDVAERILSEFFFLKEDGWHHRRCENVIDEYHEQAEKNRNNGKKGGRKPKRDAASKAKNPVGSQSDASGGAKENPDITLTINQEPLTSNQSITPLAPLEKNSRRGKKLPIGFTLPKEWIDLAISEMRCSPSAVESDQLAFIHYYTNGKGKNESHIDWQMTWRNWYRKSYSECSKSSEENSNGKRRSGIESIQDRVKGDIAQRNSGRSSAGIRASASNVIDGEFERVPY